MSVILQSWCQIQRTFSGLRYVNCGPGHIQCNYCSSYSGVNNHLNVSELIYRYWWYSDNSMRVILQLWCQIQHTFSSLRYVNCGLGPIECIYSSAYSGVNDQLNVSALLLEIPWQFNARYSENLMPNIAHMLQFTLCELWSRTCTM
jgi:hypothetical protein